LSWDIVLPRKAHEAQSAPGPLVRTALSYHKNMVDFSHFEKQIGIPFKDRRLLVKAFTHRSYINENKTVDEHNERLEFLGDAVLELAVTDYLFRNFPDQNEGDMTSYRSALVNYQTLGGIAANLGMNKFLLLSYGESKDTGRRGRLFWRILLRRLWGPFIWIRVLKGRQNLLPNMFIRLYLL